MTGGSRGGATQYKAVGGVTIERPGAPLNIANNSYARLDGHDGYILTTQAGGIGTAASMMAWVDLATLPSDAKHVFYVMGESQNGNDLDLQFESDNTLRFYTASGSHLTFTPKPATLTDRWHLIVATLDARTKARAIYWDGDLVAHDKEGGEANKTGILSIGASTVFGGRFFNGGIEEAVLWNRALTGDEVRNIYEATHTNSAHIDGVP
jgi:Concanavalin A-like lectin/glucanases superfamily